MNWIRETELASKSEQKSALCSIVSARGSSPRGIGAKMIVFEDGNILGSIGGGHLEKIVIKNALNQLVLNEPKLFRHDLLHQHGMCCGGTVEVFIEPIEKVKRLYLFGAGHIGQSLAKLAAEMDFEAYVFDDREEYISQINNDKINKLKIHHSQILPSLLFDENTFIVIMTYDHSYDREILGYCIKKPFAYLGMIGSRRKVEVTKKMFAVAKIASANELLKVDMPMGVDINAETSAEIAISIMAGLIKFKNGKNKSKMERDNQDIEKCLAGVSPIETVK